jgi:hypothetical protein
VIAFDEHDVWSLGAEREGGNIIIPLLETTYHTHNNAAGMALSFINPVPMGEDESDNDSGANTAL